MFTAGILPSGGAKEVGNELSKSAVPSGPTQFCKHFQFHWLELRNEKYSESIRHIEVFMDADAFSESNLKELFDYLSKTNPDPVGLIVVVYTDWSQFQTPSPNCPGFGCGECNSEPPRYDHQEATYWRRPEREYFRYSVKPNSPDSKTVIIRSK